MIPADLALDIFLAGVQAGFLFGVLITGMVVGWARHVTPPAPGGLVNAPRNEG